MPKRNKPTMAAEPTRYTYRVTWSEEDGEFVATCTEFPSLSWLARTQTEALAGVTALVGEVLVDLAAEGEEAPVPFAARDFSGRFNLRVGATLHRELVLAAAEEHLSLNQYVVRRLAGGPSAAPSRPGRSRQGTAAAKR